MFVSSACSCFSTVTTSGDKLFMSRDTTWYSSKAPWELWQVAREREREWGIPWRPPSSLSAVIEAFWNCWQRDELAATGTGSQNRLAETWSRGLWLATPAGRHDSSVPAGGMDHCSCHVVRVGNVVACWRGGSERGCRPSTTPAASHQPSTGKLSTCICILTVPSELSTL